MSGITAEDVLRSKTLRRSQAKAFLKLEAGKSVDRQFAARQVVLQQKWIAECEANGTYVPKTLEPQILLGGLIVRRIDQATLKAWERLAVR